VSRKSSTRIKLVLVGVAALTAACQRGEEQRRDLYATREDCLADWANKPEDCKPATEPRHAAQGFWYGPLYSVASSYWGTNGWSARSGARSIGSSSFRSSSSSSSVSRGGFGSSARSSGS
jgi:uncharacterized protein YgiB involved in biofilm formation